MMMTTTPFTYRVIHIPSGKWYYGVRYAKNCNPTDLWKTYFTSSSYVHDLIDKDGKDNFKLEIRRIFKTERDAIKWELKVLKKVLKWPSCINHSAFPAISIEARAHGNRIKAIVQKDGLTIFQQAGKKWKHKQFLIDPITGLTFKEIRAKRYNDSLDRNGTRVKHSIEWKKWFSDNNPSKRPEIKEKIRHTLLDGIASGRISTTKGRKFQSISDKLKGNKNAKNMIWINDGIKDKRILKNSNIPLGFNVGRLQSITGHKYEKLTCPYCFHIGGGGNMKRYHFDNCKVKTLLG